MAIDLSFLDDAPAPAAPAAAPTPAKKSASAAPVADAPGASGEPLQIALADIDEDASQPRQAFDQDKLDELAASIKEHGVIQPITVKPNPDKTGRWLIRYGARRFRASKQAGLKEIPAFVSEALDEYAQVIENLQRDDLSALEVAIFIQKRIDAGDSKKVIAKRLGKPADFVSIHMALIDMPPAIKAAYDEGKTGSARVISTLRGLHEKQPEKVADWIAEQSEITRKAADALADELKGRPKKAPATTQEPPASSGADFGRPKSGGEGEGGDGAGEGEKDSTPKPVKLPPGPDDGAGDGTPTKSKQSDPDAISRPLLIVEFDGRAASVLLNRRPSAAGLIRIKYEDGGGEDEVDAGQCKINRLMDGSP